MFQLDYSSILQVMLEENIALHILMHQDFVLDKKRFERILLGFDHSSAYTKKYLKDAEGDKELRRKLTLPKSELGDCVGLATETHGSIFSVKKLTAGAQNPVKKFTSVFAKRVAKTARPSDCQLCECSGHNTGTAFMTCTHCGYPNPATLDYDVSSDDDFDFKWNDDMVNGTDYEL